MNGKRVYLFKDGRADMKVMLGSKGANLAEMTVMGLPVPPGFTITTEACIRYIESGNVVPAGLLDEVHKALKYIEKETGKTFGDDENPLLLSVRSGASLSMPGMMETVLNLGLNDKTIEGLVNLTGDKRFCYDSYRRFLQMFGSVVLDIDKTAFEEILEGMKLEQSVRLDSELNETALVRLVEIFKKIIFEKTGSEFPEDPFVQLKMSIEAVFKSWNIPRAVSYRNLYKIDHKLGTAVNVQAMVFGNMGVDSATGVSFSRNPSTGENELYGEYLINAQGEDVVAGIRTPKPISELAKDMPELYEQYLNISRRLERHYQDIQDMEFTIEKGKLYILQTRAGKRTAHAALQVAIDMQKEGIITKERAMLLVDPDQLYQLLLPAFVEEELNIAVSSGKMIAKGLNASPGAAVGEVVFDPEDAEQQAKCGHKLILVRPETCPDDIKGIIHSKGILTARGGMTSHAAVVARGMGKPCVAGCEAIKVDLENEKFTVNGRVFKKGDVISIDGATGHVFEGEIKTRIPELTENFIKLLRWARDVKVLGVRANADTPADALKALELGAEGIGLCRTEHMFMAKDRLPVVREMIMAESKEERQEQLDKLFPMQYRDFVDIFRTMADKPVTIRLLDPPLHEFLPNYEEIIEEVAELKAKNADKSVLDERKKLLKKVSELKESNPMMGLRGCRLGLVYPEINEMQVRAIFEAACDLKIEGIDIHPEVMIPLVGHENELKTVRAQLEQLASDIMDKKGVRIEYQFGTMIELPRACVVADKIAEYAEFFSFGTNDLTQMTFGFSRDDAESKFLNCYLEKKILPVNPFEVIDRDGVGALMQIALQKGKSAKSYIKTGICGEHGGEPSSVKFCHTIGLAYVSCSPFRVPIATLAAAQAVLEEKGKGIVIHH